MDFMKYDFIFVGSNTSDLNFCTSSISQASAVEGEEDPARGLSSFNALHVALLHLYCIPK